MVMDSTGTWDEGLDGVADGRLDEDAPVLGVADVEGVDGLDVDAAGGVEGPEGLSQAQRRKAALREYLEALRSPDCRSDDPVVAARALVRIDDAREAYRDAGGSPGSQWSLQYRAVYLDARELLGEDVAERRAELAAELEAARADEGRSKG